MRKQRLQFGVGPRPALAGRFECNVEALPWVPDDQAKIEAGIFQDGLDLSEAIPSGLAGGLPVWVLEPCAKSIPLRSGQQVDGRIASELFTQNDGTQAGAD